MLHWTVPQKTSSWQQHLHTVWWWPHPSEWWCPVYQPSLLPASGSHQPLLHGQWNSPSPGWQHFALDHCCSHYECSGLFVGHQRRQTSRKLWKHNHSALWSAWTKLIAAGQSILILLVVINEMPYPNTQFTYSIQSVTVATQGDWATWFIPLIFFTNVPSPEVETLTKTWHFQNFWSSSSHGTQMSQIFRGSLPPDPH